jgi:hypothetical protein
MMDDQFERSEYVVLHVSRTDLADNRVLLRKAWWLNPPGFTSTRMSIEFPELCTDEPWHTVQRDLVAGWRCELCRGTFFATDLEGLRHAPCCGGEVCPRS